MTNWRCSALVVCPYYLRENERFIVCEGLMERVEMSLHFDDQARKIAYQRNTCCTWGYAKRCPNAAALEAKYRAGKGKEDDGETGDLHT